MRNALTKVAATALLSMIAVVSVPAGSASAIVRLEDPGWTLQSTRTVGSKTFYRYVHTSGQVAVTDQRRSEVQQWTRVQ